VYNAIKVSLPPISAQGFEALPLPGSLLFTYNSATAKLLKLAIAKPPSRMYNYRDYIIVAVFNIAIALTTGDNPASSSWELMSPTTLAPDYYEDAISHADRRCAVTTGGTCFVWDPKTYG
jgi:hypothetical protein